MPKVNTTEGLLTTKKVKRRRRRPRPLLCALEDGTGSETSSAHSPQLGSQLEWSIPPVATLFEAVGDLETYFPSDTQSRSGKALPSIQFLLRSHRYPPPLEFPVPKLPSAMLLRPYTPPFRLANTDFQLRVCGMDVFFKNLRPKRGPKFLLGSRIVIDGYDPPNASLFIVNALCHSDTRIALSVEPCDQRGHIIVDGLYNLRKVILICSRSQAALSSLYPYHRDFFFETDLMRKKGSIDKNALEGFADVMQYTDPDRPLTRPSVSVSSTAHASVSSVAQNDHNVPTPGYRILASVYPPVQINLEAQSTNDDNGDHVPAPQAPAPATAKKKKEPKRKGRPKVSDRYSSPGVEDDVHMVTSYTSGAPVAYSAPLNIWCTDDNGRVDFGGGATYNVHTVASSNPTQVSFPANAAQHRDIVQVHCGKWKTQIAPRALPSNIEAPEFSQFIAMDGIDDGRKTRVGSAKWYARMNRTSSDT